MTAQPSTDETDRAAPLPATAPARNNPPPVPIVELPPERGTTAAESTPALALQLDRSGRNLMLRGELDIATVPILADVLAVLLDRYPGDSVIDFAGVSFIDAAGLGCLVAHSHRLAEIGAKISIVGSTPRVHRIFDIVGLGDLLAAS